MPVTSDSFLGDGVTADYFYNFELKGSFNTVNVGTKTPDEPNYTVAVEGTDYLHIPASKRITFLSGSIPASGVQGLITRATSRARSVDHIDGSTLTAAILDNDANRLATVDPEIEDRVIQVRTTIPVAGEMPITPGDITTLDMGIEADLLILQGVVSPANGIAGVTYTVIMPAEGEAVRSAGTTIGSGVTSAPELTFIRNSDPTLVDVLMRQSNGFVEWDQIKLVAMKFPIVANL